LQPNSKLHGCFEVQEHRNTATWSWKIPNSYMLSGNGAEMVKTWKKLL